MKNGAITFKPADFGTQRISYGGAGFDGTYGYGFGSPGYDAVKDQGSRKAPIGRSLSEDQELQQLPRRQMSTTIRDLTRNFSVAAWMIRQHLDYISTFHFQPKTGDKGLDKALEEFMEWYSRAENCDPGGRHRLERMMRMWELLRVIDGDTLTNNLADGRIQTIESDRIQSNGMVPYDLLGIKDPQNVVNGVYVNQNFRAISYLVFKRIPNWTGLEFDKAVPSRFADLFAYYTRIDQVRGISPMTTAANSLRDVYENFDYALLKAKVSQLMAFAFFREGSEDLGEEGVDVPPSPAVNGQPPVPQQQRPSYGEVLQKQLKFRNGGNPLLLDLDPGDDAKIIESQTPSTQFQAFNQAMIMVALKALDIPFSFYDESHTNYSGSRLAGINYEKSAGIKRGDLRALLDKKTRWRLGLAVVDGDIKLPAGKTVQDLKWEWAHTGIPWYDPLKEVSGAVAAVNAGFSSPQRECHKLGLDAFKIVDERAEIEAYAKEKGVVLSTALASVYIDDPANTRAIDEAQNQDQQNQQADDQAAGKNKGAKGESGMVKK